MILLMLMTTGCSEFAFLASGTSFAVSQNAYAKSYNGRYFNNYKYRKKYKNTYN